MVSGFFPWGMDSGARSEFSGIATGALTKNDLWSSSREPMR